MTELGEDLGSMHRQVKTIANLIDTPPADREAVDLSAIVATVAEELPLAYPAADITVEANAAVGALGGDPVEVAVPELAINALEHAGRSRERDSWR